jgi:succinate-semialdehyde dehydrogenase / glutarate-semialdehyde dehydrogenase
MELMLLGGEMRGAASGSTIEVLNPATLDAFDSVPDATTEDAVAAMAYASDNKKRWARTPLHERIAMVDRFLVMLRDHHEELARIITMETGKPIAEGEDEVDTAYWIFRGYNERVGPAMYGMATELDLQAGLPGDYMITRREPLGVVVAILPFNFPIEMYAHKVAPALLSGNAVVVKPSEETPLSALKITQWLHECGVPSYALQCITGRGSVAGEALVTDPRADAITMTGSTAVGRHVYESGAKNLARVFLELGGNDPLIVLPDADLDALIPLAVRSRTYCAGQCCCAAKRMLVHTSVADDFTERLTAALQGLMPGDPMSEDTKMGTLISREAALRAESQVQRAVEQGATIALGASVSGASFAPTILQGVTADMEVARDTEIFAPVFPIIEAGSEAELLDIANSTIYGLNAGVFTKDVERAFTFAAELEYGLVVINGSPLYRPYNHLHGGYKATGIGREGLDGTLEDMTQSKGIAFRRVLRPPTN